MQTAAPARLDDRWPLLFPGLLAVVLTIHVLAMLSVPWPPLQDLGGHIELMDIMARYGSPATLYEATYLLPESFGPNTLSLHLASWLAPIFDPLTVARLLIVFYVVGLPLAIWSLTGAFGRSRWLTFLACPLTFNTMLLLGFLNFLVALPLLIWAIAHARRLAEHGGLGRGVTLAVILVALFFAHVIPYAIAVAATLGLVVLFLPHWTALTRLTPLALSLPFLAVWMKRMFFAPSGSTASESFAALEPTYKPAGKLLMQFHSWGMQTFRAELDEVAFGAVVLLFVVALAVGFAQRRARKVTPARLTSRRTRLLRWTRRHALELLTVGAFAGYFVVPSRSNEMAIIGERFVVLTLLLLVPWPRIQLIGPARALLVPMFGLAAMYPLAVIGEYARFDVDVLGSLPEVVEDLPARTRLLVIFNDHENPITYHQPIWHVAKAVNATANGGITNDSFAVRPYTPIQYQPGAVPFTPQHDVHHAATIRDWDYVLVRQPLRPDALLVQPWARPLWSEAGWWLLAVQPQGPLRYATMSRDLGLGAQETSCADGLILRGVKATTSEAAALRRVEPLCTAKDDGAATAAKAVAAGQVECDPGQTIVGLHGSLVAGEPSSLGLDCAAGAGGRSSVDPIGATTNERWTVACPNGSMAVGIRTRGEGSLTAVGLLCESTRRPTAHARYDPLGPR